MIYFVTDPFVHVVHRPVWLLPYRLSSGEEIHTWGGFFDRSEGAVEHAGGAPDERLHVFKYAVGDPPQVHLFAHVRRGDRLGCCLIRHE